MPLKGNDADQLNYFLVTQDDVFSDGIDGTTAGKATATIIKSEDLGRRGDAAAGSDTASSSLIGLFKRLLSNTLSGVASNLSTLAGTVAGGHVQTTVTNTVISIDDNNESLTVDNNGTFPVQLSGALPAGSNLIGQVDINSTPFALGSGNADASTQRVVIAGNQTLPVTLPSLPAGDNNIGNVDIATLPIAFNAGPANTFTPRVVIASDQSVPVNFLGALPAGANNIGSVNINTFPVSFGAGVADGATQRVIIANNQTVPVNFSGALPAGTNNIGDVDVATLPVSFGAGVVDASTQRVVLVDSQSVGISSLPPLTSGTNLIGKVDVNDIATPTSLYHGRATVTSAGEAEALPAQTLKSGVTVKALFGNTGVVYVGNSTVTELNGLELFPGDQIFIEIDNLSDVYIDVATGGDGVSYVAS